MTVYAPVPAYADRKRHPRALFLIIAGHAAILAAVMTVKMDLPNPFSPTRTDVTLVPLPPEPPTEQPQPPEKHRESMIDRVPAVVPVPQPPPPQIDIRPMPAPTQLPAVGPVTEPQPRADATSAAPARTGPRFTTPGSRVKPPYPQQKLRSEEEAVLRLRLSIDERGRVTSVEPVGSADAVFLSAARRHLIAHRRYQPATEAGRATASSTVITLRFELE